jgi:predicted nucleic acid-binding Zn ribbon protein
VNPSHVEPVTHAENMARSESGKYLRERTHCPKGHLYDQQNTYVRTKSDGGGRNHRTCRACQRERVASRREQGKESRPDRKCATCGASIDRHEQLSKKFCSRSCKAKHDARTRRLKIVSGAA